MHKNWSAYTGWAAHSMFGLRREWVDLYISDPQNWFVGTSLGNRQVDSLKVWLITSGLLVPGGYESNLTTLFRKYGTFNKLPWQILWINTVFSFATARWYISLGYGEWSTSELQKMLHQNVQRISERTTKNAIAELAGLLERTPIGKDLSQGKLVDLRPRVFRRDSFQPSDEAILHSLYRLFCEAGNRRIDFSENHVLWPWDIFACRKDYVLERLLAINDQDITVDSHGICCGNTIKEWWKWPIIETI